LLQQGEREAQKVEGMAVVKWKRKIINGSKATKVVIIDEDIPC
jgi:hypothetical protein